MRRGRADRRLAPAVGGLAQVAAAAVHVVKEPDDGGVPDRVPEEEGLHRGGPDHTQQRDGQEEAAEASRLPRVAGADKVAEDALRLVLQHLHGVDRAQTGGL